MKINYIYIYYIYIISIIAILAKCLHANREISILYIYILRYEN